MNLGRWGSYAMYSVE